MPQSEPKSFSPTRLGPEARALLDSARSVGRVSASLTEDGPGSDGLARYALLEALCSKGLLAYDGEDGSNDDLELGFVITEAGHAYLAAA